MIYAICEVNDSLKNFLKELDILEDGQTDTQQDYEEVKQDENVQNNAESILEATLIIKHPQDVSKLKQIAEHYRKSHFSGQGQEIQ